MITKKTPWTVEEIQEPSTFLFNLIEKRKNIEDILKPTWNQSTLHFFLVSFLQ
jgi:hypothetical protein